MKILSIETSGNICGVALSGNKQLLCEYNSFTNNSHDKLLAEYISRILSDNDMIVDDLDAVAISSGPGSFTGLRIGGAVAKSLCYSNKPKLIAVPTLDSVSAAAVKYNCNKSNICVCIKSHKDMVYFRIYDSFGFPQSEIYFDTLEELQKYLLPSTMLCGNGFPNSFEKIYFNEGIKAGYIDVYAQKLYQNHEFTRPEDFEPLYVQEFVPKNNL